MGAELVQWLVGHLTVLPYHQLVVVAARRDVLVVEGPLEAADLLLVPFQLRNIILFLSQVSVQDALVLGPR